MSSQESQKLTDKTSVSELEEKSIWQSRADLLGATASFLCALHCALTPLVLTLIPVAGLGALAGGGFEKGFIVFAAVYGAFVIGSGFCSHRIQSVIAVFVTGVVLLAIAAFTTVHDVSWLHAVLMTSGGAMIAVAHLRNRKGVCECAASKQR